MTGCRIPTMSFGTFSNMIHRVVGPSRTPINGSIELTYRCNIRCEHCYIPHRSGEGELGTDEWKRIVDQATEAGCLFLLISGGEPFLRRDALDIYLHAKRNGLLVTLFTNATMVTPQIAEMLGEYPPFSVEVTVYGASAASYERVARVGKAFEKAKRGIRLLKDARIPLSLKTVVLTLNRGDLPKIRAMAEDLDVPFRFDATMHPRLDGNRAPLPIRLTPDDVVTLDADSPERLAEMRELHERQRGPSDPSRLFQCGAGRNSFHVDPFGRLMLCESVGSFGYDLKGGSLLDGWNGYVAKILELEASRWTRCNECDLHSLCGQCPAWSLMENGTLDDPVDYLCDITAARAEAMGLPDRPPGWTPGKRRLRQEAAPRGDAEEAGTGPPTRFRTLLPLVGSTLPTCPGRHGCEDSR